MSGKIGDPATGSISAKMAMLWSSCWADVRRSASRPILNGHEAVVLYWISYLSLFMLGIVMALAAVLR